VTAAGGPADTPAVDAALAARARAAGVPFAYVDDRGRTVGIEPDAVAAVCDLLGDPAEVGAGPYATVVVAWDGLREGRRYAFGYHDVEVPDPDRPGRALPALLVSAPRRPVTAFDPAAPRRWGVFVPLHGLRTAAIDAAGRGVASYRDLGSVFDWLHRHGGQVVATLPLLAGHLDADGDPSPYAPTSRRFWNELYVDLPVALALLHADGPVPPAPPPTGRHLDTVGLWRHRRRVLGPAIERFWAVGASSAFHRFVEEHPDVATYAAFRAAQVAHGRNWRAWPGGGADLPAGDPAEVRFHAVAQWLCHEQLGELARRTRERGQLLGLDLALGSHADGFDAWADRAVTVAGAAVGAPPDAFFRAGQNWGFPPLHPWRSRAHGHAAFRAVLAAHLRHAGMLRIDHVMGLFRQWWVPAGAPAHVGAYVPYPAEELFAIVCLEAHRAGAVIVGENLGTVPAAVNALLEDHGLLGIDVVQERLGEVLTPGGLAPVPARCAVMLTTHDHVPFASWWEGGDIERMASLHLADDDELASRRAGRPAHRGAVRRAFALGDDAGPVAAAQAITRWMATSDAALAVVGIEDLWGETEAQNTPGTGAERPNFRRRLAVPLEAWDTQPGVAGVLAAMAAARP
jgi:4-alpha-glucanotransferase